MKTKLYKKVDLGDQGCEFFEQITSTYSTLIISFILLKKKSIILISISDE
nr:hypothetical protein Itr_chr15CG14640 [Ipomoea trifida]